MRLMIWLDERWWRMPLLIVAVAALAALITGTHPGHCHPVPVSVPGKMHVTLACR